MCAHTRKLVSNRLLGDQAKAGLLYKSIVQKPASANPKGKGKPDDISDIMSRFIMLYLSRFQDHILLEEGCRLEVTTTMSICCLL